MNTPSGSWPASPTGQHQRAPRSYRGIAVTAVKGVRLTALSQGPGILSLSWVPWLSLHQGEHHVPANTAIDEAALVPGIRHVHLVEGARLDILVREGGSATRR